MSYTVLKERKSLKNSLRLMLFVLILSIFNLSAFSFSIGKSKEDAKFFFAKGIEYHKEDYVEDAIENYDKAIKLSPYNEQIYFNRGLAKNQLGDYEGAIKDFDMVLKLQPKDDASYFNRGIAKYYLKDYQSALQDFNATIAMIPGDAKALYNRALTKYQMGDLRGALEDGELARDFYKELKMKAFYDEADKFVKKLRSGSV